MNASHKAYVDDQDDLQASFILLCSVYCANTEQRHELSVRHLFVRKASVQRTRSFNSGAQVTTRRPTSLHA